MNDTFANPRPIAPTAMPVLAQASEAYLTWLRFRRHKLAMAGLILVILMYVVAILAELVAPVSPDHSNARLVCHPPQMIHWIDSTADDWHLRPYVVPLRSTRDPVTLAARYVPDATRKIYLGLFVDGDTYRF